MTRRPDEPDPLTEEVLTHLERVSSVAGLSSADARRLLAEVRRLRQLVIDAARVLATSGPPADKRAREVYDAIKDEAKR